MRCIACFQLREELKGIVLSFEVRKTVGQDLQVTYFAVGRYFSTIYVFDVLFGICEIN